MEKTMEEEEKEEVASETEEIIREMEELVAKMFKWSDWYNNLILYKI